MRQSRRQTKPVPVPARMKSSQSSFGYSLKWLALRKITGQCESGFAGSTGVGTKSCRPGCEALSSGLEKGSVMVERDEVFIEAH